MTIYLIHGNEVAARTTPPAKSPKGAILIHSLKDLEGSGLPMARLVAIWNALPCSKRISKFKSRKMALQRLWAAFERMAPHVEAKAQPRHETHTRSDSKQAQVIELLRRSKGATIEELAGAIGWQHHSVRGLLSGALNKRLGLTIASTKEERGRVYRIADSRAEE